MAIRNIVWRVYDGHDSYRIETDRNSNGVKPNGCLWFGKEVPRDYKTVMVDGIDEEGQPIQIETQVPVDHELCKWIDGDNAPTSRTQEEIDIIQAEKLAEEQERIQKLVDNPIYKAMVEELQHDLTILGLTIPSTEMDVMVKVATLKSQGLYTETHRQAKASIGVTWQAVKDANIHNDIGAIWDIIKNS
jgi:hypothetical protein